ncbi:MAG: IS21 family transposase [Deltaproteobacteria bacterium]|jgi:transposase|nr:MAG: IS21 family transposase [Deltaproteobacteria bacterium]
MIDPSKEELIRELARNGSSQRKIAELLKISRNTVQRVLDSPATRPAPKRESRYADHLPIIKDLLQQCRGNLVRVQEELVTRHQLEIPYQSLSWLVRDHQLRQPAVKRAGQYSFAPGEELQHDTSPHRLTVDGKVVTGQCAALVLAYSRRLFIQYFPRFTRFECRVFLAEGLDYMGGSCPRCVIDNTSVIVCRGSGAEAVMAPEMEMFGRIYAMEFVAHRVKNPDRKARVERPFSYVENNFLAGRTFDDWQDLNRQARDWCDHVTNRKEKKDLGMSPDAAWLLEKTALQALPQVSPPIYESYPRTVDQEGYVHLDTNRYSVPETLIGKDVEVLKYWQRVVVYHGRRLVAEHPRVLLGRDKRVTAPGHHQPLCRKKAFQGPSREEQHLTGHHPELDRYLGELKKRSKGRGQMQLRRLLDLKRSYPVEPFFAAIQEALHYGLFDLNRLEKMILKNTRGFFELP